MLRVMSEQEVPSLFLSVVSLPCTQRFSRGSFLPHLQAGHMAVPGCEALRVLGRHAGRGAVGPPEHDGAVDGARAHVQGLGCRVDDLVDGLHRKVERHELADGLKAAEGRAHGDAGEARLQACSATGVLKFLPQMAFLHIGRHLDACQLDALIWTLHDHEPPSGISEHCGCV